MKFVITGYYDKNNYGDDLFKEIATTIFIDKNKIEECSIIPIDRLIEYTKLNSSAPCDRLILFGGETLNNYFLDILIKFKEIIEKKFQKPLLLNAVGVSCNQEYNSVVNKVNLFDYIIFRSKKDFDFFQHRIPCRYCPDIVFLYKPETKTSLFSSSSSSYKQHYNKKYKKNQTVGFFLAQPALHGKKPEDIRKYIKTIVSYIQYFLKRKFKIALFPMGINKKEAENDNILNGKIYCALNKEEKEEVAVYNNNNYILENMSSLRFAVCWRFHAHILSIIYNIPFISLSDTPKVTALLKDNKLEALALTDSKMAINTFNYLLENEVQLKAQLKEVHKECYAEAKKCYKDMTIYFNEYNKKTYYINELDTLLIYSTITKKYTDLCLNYKKENKENKLTYDDKAMIILFSLLRTIHCDYAHGLSAKIQQLTEKKYNSGISNIASTAPIVTLLKNDIMWLINDCIITNNSLFYDTVKPIISTFEKSSAKESTPTFGTTFGTTFGKSSAKDEKSIIEASIAKKAILNYNINYIDQNEYKGLHRAGWSYIVDAFTKYASNSDENVLCDLYLDSTFHWNLEKYLILKQIPYTKPWIGFIHHTCEEDYSPNNTVNLFKNKYFLQSLKTCKGLIVLSAHLKEQVEKLLLAQPKVKDKIKVYNLTHPTEFVEKLFTIEKFNKEGERKIIQVGAWLRNLNAINELDLKENPLKLHKYILKGKKMEKYYAPKIEEDKEEADGVVCECICRIKDPKLTYLDADVNVLEYLDNNAYDECLSANIVFINLIGASAVNTIIECIVRNTPILVNRLPATIEMLGEKYPLFYDDIKDVSELLTLKKITKGWQYLKQMDKTKFRLETFIKELYFLEKSIAKN